MIKTKTAIKRDKRNERIKSLYTEYMAQEGSMRSAVLDRIAQEVRVSVTTAHRATK